MNSKSQLLAIGLALLSALSWGVWGYLSNAVARHHSGIGLWMSSILMEALIVSPFLLKERPIVSLSVAAVALFGAGGFLLFFLALKLTTSPAPIVAVTAVYPAVTLVLQVIYGGSVLSSRQYVGMALAIGAVALLSS